VFAGFRDDVASLYDACDVFVLPSVRDESMSHALLEAMACGRAVVASEVAAAGLARAREAGACRVVPPGDAHALAAALAELLGDRAARERMGHAARELVLREHSREAATDQLEAILHEVEAERLSRGDVPFLSRNAAVPIREGKGTSPRERASLTR
jgi:glycosyltransferase involved in cell wall biosynthesis